MTEQNPQNSYESRIAKCPIHKALNVDQFLYDEVIPDHLWRPFHEIMLIRGELPRFPSRKQLKEFAQKAVAITKDYDLLPMEGYLLMDAFEKLAEYWKRGRTDLN